MTPGDVSKLFARFDREVWLVTAQAGTRRGGLIATFVNQASIVPECPRVVLGIARQHFTWDLIESSGGFALHLLRPEQLDWVWRFGLSSGRDADKLEGLQMRAGTSGSPLLSDAIGWLDCRVETRMHVGDRTIYLAEVLDANTSDNSPCLTVKQMIQSAPPDRLTDLKNQMVRDSGIDAEAIRSWRANRSGQ